MAASQTDGPTSQQAARRPDPDDVTAHFFAALRAGTTPRFDEFDEHPDLPEEARDLLLRRLEAGWAEGLLRITPDQFVDVLMILLPEEAVLSLPVTPASQDAPGTPGRLAAYAERAQARESIFDAADAEAVRDDRKAVRAKAKANGTGVQSAGWDQEEAPPVPPGMYRTPYGSWFDLN